MHKTQKLIGLQEILAQESDLQTCNEPYLHKDTYTYYDKMKNNK